MAAFGASHAGIASAFTPDERKRIEWLGPWPIAFKPDPSNRVSGKPLAIELGPYTINVNCICPTQMTDRSIERGAAGPGHAYWEMVTGTANPTYEDYDVASGRENLFEEGGQPDFSEIAEAALWLASDRSFPVTGHALPADRGWIAKRGG